MVRVHICCHMLFATSMSKRWLFLNVRKSRDIYVGCPPQWSSSSSSHNRSCLYSQTCHHSLQPRREHFKSTYMPFIRLHPPCACALLSNRIPSLLSPMFFSLPRQQLSPGAPGPRKSLLSDMINSSQNNQLERNAHRRRVLKSMRRYSVDASETNFDVLGLYPSGRASPLKGIPSEGEEAATSTNGAPEFKDTPTVRYLRPGNANSKTKLSATLRRGDSENTADYFGIEDRVW